MSVPTPPTPFPVVRPSDLRTSAVSSAPWLIDQLWTAQAVGIIGGTPKSYKTWMALEMAVAVASGSACLATFAVPLPGPVLLYAAEDSESALRLRLESLVHHHRLMLAKMSRPPVERATVSVAPPISMRGSIHSSTCAVTTAN